MTGTVQAFEAAVADGLKLDVRPDNASLLQLYALYKQALAGDADGTRPGFADMVGRAKWDAWKALQGTSADVAMQRYASLVDKLKQRG